MFDEFSTSVDGLQRNVNRGRAINVNDQKTKRQAINLAKNYFGQIRDHLVSIRIESELTKDLDEQFQYLVALAHQNNSRASYLRTLKRIKKLLQQASVRMVTLTSREHTDISATRALQPDETAIIKTLTELIPTAAASYQQAVLDMRNGKRLSYRGTAAELRESLRELIDHLSPDEAVMKKPGFKLENAKTTPTMKQKVQFLLSERGRNKTQIDTTTKAVELVEQLVAELTRAVYNEASLATHVQRSRQDVTRLKKYLDTVYHDLLELGA